MRTVADLWDTYAAHVMPAAATVAQRIEMRRSFYAGAQALLGLQQMLCGDDTISDAAYAAIGDGIQDELMRFGEMVGKGLA